MDVRYIRETYIDIYHTLTQTILIDCYLDSMSDGCHSRYLRGTINPNLHLYLIEHINKDRKVIYSKKLSEK